jgi:hypothetical protein
MFFSHGHTWTHMDEFFLHARLGMKKTLYAFGMVIYYKVAAWGVYRAWSGPINCPCKSMWVHGQFNKGPDILGYFKSLFPTYL